MVPSGPLISLIACRRALRAVRDPAQKRFFFFAPIDSSGIEGVTFKARARSCDDESASFSASSRILPLPRAHGLGQDLF